MNHAIPKNGGFGKIPIYGDITNICFFHYRMVFFVSVWVWRNEFDALDYVRSICIGFLSLFIVLIGDSVYEDEE